MGEGMILVAIGCGRLAAMLDIASKHPFVVFGTIEGEVLAGLVARPAGLCGISLPVYFYETG